MSDTYYTKKDIEGGKNTTISSNLQSHVKRSEKIFQL